jgi:hypothetical protein
MGVTHLICSKDHYKREVQAVQKAKQLKGCRLVTYDWFGDCLLKKKRLHLKHYEAEDAYGISVKKRTERKRKERKQLKKDGKSFPPSKTPLEVLKVMVLTSQSVASTKVA